METDILMRCRLTSENDSIFSVCFTTFSEILRARVCVYLLILEKFERSSSCEHNKLATIMLVS